MYGDGALEIYLELWLEVSVVAAVLMFLSNATNDVFIMFHSERVQIERRQKDIPAPGKSKNSLNGLAVVLRLGENQPGRRFY